MRYEFTYSEGFSLEEEKVEIIEANSHENAIRELLKGKTKTLFFSCVYESGGFFTFMAYKSFLLHEFPHLYKTIVN